MVAGYPVTDGLNALTGAWCSLTTVIVHVTFWVMLSQCTYRCVVLPDYDYRDVRARAQWSQCTYRCVVLPDAMTRRREARANYRLNAPTGAWCSLTTRCESYNMLLLFGLNAPTGAWCSLTVLAVAEYRVKIVSMHLQVRGAP